jgi:hypothetical protein
MKQDWVCYVIGALGVSLKVMMSFGFLFIEVNENHTTSLPNPASNYKIAPMRQNEYLFDVIVLFQIESKLNYDLYNKLPFKL